ncbi:hypothetical protein JCM24511_00860 [Saitozyma sp. JCM 24511]|nr:hypothetical protein JCM24511_00860 [Saitozyma sp. JCM 24511]
MPAAAPMSMSPTTTSASASSASFAPSTSAPSHSVTPTSAPASASTRRAPIPGGLRARSKASCADVVTSTGLWGQPGALKPAASQRPLPPKPQNDDHQVLVPI